jgi:hypothetical protein
MLKIWTKWECAGHARTRSQSLCSVIPDRTKNVGHLLCTLNELIPQFDKHEHSETPHIKRCSANPLSACSYVMNSLSSSYYIYVYIYWG